VKIGSQIRIFVIVVSIVFYFSYIQYRFKIFNIHWVDKKVEQQDTEISVSKAKEEIGSILGEWVKAKPVDEIVDKIPTPQASKSSIPVTQIGNFKDGETYEIFIINNKGEPVLLNLQAAVTDESKERGLMFQEHIENNEGKIFVYERNVKNRFWMKNCLISLDIIFVGSDGKIVDISRSVPPCEADPCKTYGSLLPYRYVIEVNAGWTMENNVRTGNKVEI